MKMYKVFKGYGIYRKVGRPTLCEYHENLSVLEKAKKIYEKAEIPVSIYPIEISRGDREIK